jgi:hypothetical protein
MGAIMTPSDADFFKVAISRRVTEIPPVLKGEPCSTDAERAALAVKLLAYIESKRPAPLNAPEESRT